jgi:hypothetical protein
MSCRSVRSEKQGDSIQNLVTSLEILKTVIKVLVKHHYFRNQFLKYPVGNSSTGTKQPLQPSKLSSFTFATIAID